MDTDSEGHQIPVLRACPGEVAEENVIFQVGQRVDGYGIQDRSVDYDFYFKQN